MVRRFGFVCGLAALAAVLAGCARFRPGDLLSKSRSKDPASTVASDDSGPKSKRRAGRNGSSPAKSPDDEDDDDDEDRPSIAATRAPSPTRISDVASTTDPALNRELASKSTTLPLGHNPGYHLGPPVTLPVQSNAPATLTPNADARPTPSPVQKTGTAALQVQATGQADGSSASGTPSITPTTVTAEKLTTPANAPVAMGSYPGAVSSQTELGRLISSAETEASAAKPGMTDALQQEYIKKQVNLRLLYLMAGQQERALQAIPGLDSADQEFWQQTFWGLTNYFDSDSIPSSADRAAQTVAQLQTAVLRLQEKANLDLRNVAFCHKISSFGNYEKYPRDEFSPGQEVLVYAEVANIHSETTPDSKYRTKLKSTLEVLRHGPQPDVVERIDMPETVDLCRTHRRDYFHVYQFTIPTKLTPGPHVLKLTVEDQISRRQATYTVNFTVK